MPDIDKTTKVPLFVVLAAAPVIIAGAMWMNSVDNKASAAEEQTKEIRPLLLDILQRVIRIEAGRRGK